ncbi:hypothetical protein AB0D11_48560 [Streptomyces monashensis]|uniref:hypothetical protein n=1 Tax=Streptomyces monashensis TaxID=1678012 RepID=UPI00340BD8EF
MQHAAAARRDGLLHQQHLYPAWLMQMLRCTHDTSSSTRDDHHQDREQHHHNNRHLPEPTVQHLLHATGEQHDPEQQHSAAAGPRLTPSQRTPLT